MKFIYMVFKVYYLQHRFFRYKNINLFKLFLIYRIAGFFEIFTICPCPDYQGENFHKSSITLSAYYIILTPANAIIVINNSNPSLPAWQSISRWSPLWEDTTFTRMYGLLQLEQHYLVNKKCSFFERTIWPIANLVKCWTVENTPYFAVSLATLAFSSAENFSYFPSITVPFSIMVSTTSFILSLIASICEEGMVCVKDPLEVGKTASLLPRLLSFSRVGQLWNTILKQCYFVNA